MTRRAQQKEAVQAEKGRSREEEDKRKRGMEAWQRRHEEEVRDKRESGRGGRGNRVAQGRVSGRGGGAEELR